MGKAPRVRFGGADNEDGRTFRDLQEAVHEYCREKCVQHFGRMPPELGSISVDMIQQDEAYRVAQAQLHRAAPLFKDIVRTTQELKNLGEQGLVSNEAVETAARIAAKAENFLSIFEIPPNRPMWVECRFSRFFDTESTPVDVITAIALLAGWWPETVDERSVREDGASPAGVFRLEEKNIKAALRARAEQRQRLANDPGMELIAKALGIDTPTTQQ